MSENPVYKFAIREDLSDTGDLFLPKQAEPDAVGYDVRAAPADRKDIIIRAGKYVRIPLGFRAFCPDGWWYQLHPRSSLFAKKQSHQLIGIIDTSFPLELMAVVQYLPDISSLANDLVIAFGDPIGQIIPVKRQIMQVEKISNSDIEKLYKNRSAVRTGGFGSTH